MIKERVRSFLCCSVLQCVAVCCSALQCVAERGTIKEDVRSFVCCNVLQCVAVRCSVWQCVAVRCRALQYVVRSRKECGHSWFAVRCSVSQGVV